MSENKKNSNKFQTDVEKSAPMEAETEKPHEMSEKSGAEQAAENTKEIKPCEETKPAVADIEQNKSGADKPRRGAVIAASVCGVVLLAIIITCTVFVSFVSGYDKIYPNVYVGKIDASGMTVDDIKSAAELMYNRDAVNGHEIGFSCNGVGSTIITDNLGMDFDIDKTVADAYSAGRSDSALKSAMNYLSCMMKRTNVRPEPVYDTQALIGAINDLVTQFEVEPHSYQYSLEGNTLKITKPETGIKVDRDAAARAVEDSIISFSFAPVTFYPKEKPPPKFNMDNFYAELTQTSENSVYQKIDGVISATPGRPSIIVERALVEAAIDAIDSGNESYSLTVETVAPAVTQEYLTSILYSQVLGSYSSNFAGSSAARAGNVRLSAKHINGVELMPGEEFSYDKTVGPRTAANGFQPAPVYVIKIENGVKDTKSEMGMGGGICQTSSTLYAAALKARIKVLERHPHSKPVTYMPEGMDATISEGSLDLRLKNDTDYPMKIVAEINGATLTCKFLGYRE